ncbi:MAG: DinB family protein [Candidatus Sulfotelmatobacter sp.]
MAPAAVAVSNEIEVLQHQARVTQRVMRLNVEGISHEESLIQPQPAGNCLNWVIGDLVFAYELIFPLLGQKPVMGEGRLKPYARHSSPLRDSAEAVPLQELLAAFDKASERMDAGLADLVTKKLDEPAPYSPTNDSKETVRSLLARYLVPSGLSRGANGTSSPSRWQAWGNCLSVTRL